MISCTKEVRKGKKRGKLRGEKEEFRKGTKKENNKTQCIHDNDV